MQFRLLIPALLFSIVSFAQVPKQVVVEHFTNTVCGVCALRNPGFYSNLNAQADVLHLAIHPSSPYDFCILNLNNVEENDARTNYYGVYGGTPRFVIQGTVIAPLGDYSDPSLFTPYLGETSVASIRIEQVKYGSDSIYNNIIIKTEAAHALSNLKLFAALSEDTIFYSSPNGEDEHYDVFRKSLFDTEGMSVTLPATVGDSVVYSSFQLLDSEWDANRIYTIAILQDALTKEVIQAAAHSTFSDSLVVIDTNTTSINDLTEVASITIYPNPASDFIDLNFISAETSEIKIQITAIDGQIKLIKEIKPLGNIFSERIDISSFATGIYLMSVFDDRGMVSKQFIVK